MIFSHIFLQLFLVSKKAYKNYFFVSVWIVDSHDFNDKKSLFAYNNLFFDFTVKFTNNFT